MIRLDSAFEVDPRIAIGPLRIDAVDESQCIIRIMDSLAAGQGGWLITANLDHLRRLVRDPQLACLYRQADLIVADGMPLVWASRLQGTPLPQRVAGSTLVSKLAAIAMFRGFSIYLLGGAPGTADDAAVALRTRYPGLRIAGTDCPPMGFDRNEGQVRQVLRRLREADPDIIYVGLGSPKQERLIARVRDQLPTAWWMGVGISFSFLAGRIRRAPPWMQNHGLEWLHRLAQEPARLSRRYLMDDLPFAVGLLIEAATRRVGAWRLSHRLSAARR